MAAGTLCTTENTGKPAGPYQFLMHISRVTCRHIWCDGMYFLINDDDCNGSHYREIASILRTCLEMATGRHSGMTSSMKLQKHVTEAFCILIILKYSSSLYLSCDRCFILYRNDDEEKGSHNRC